MNNSFVDFSLDATIIVDLKVNASRFFFLRFKAVDSDVRLDRIEIYV